MTGNESHVTLDIEHLLKLEYSSAADPRRGWRRSVRDHRSAAIRILEDSASLDTRIRASLARCFAPARENAAESIAADGVSDASLPATPPYSIDRILDRRFFPPNRHGHS